MRCSCKYMKSYIIDNTVDVMLEEFINEEYDFDAIKEDIGIPWIITMVMTQIYVNWLQNNPR